MVKEAAGAIGAAALGLTLALRLADGSYTSLVQGWYGPVLVATAALLLGLAILAAVRWVTRGGESMRLSPWSLVAIGLGAAPVVLALLMKPEPLGSASLDVEENALATWQLEPGDTGANPASRNVYQWYWEFANTEPSTLIGQPIDVIGFVFRGEDNAPATFRVARFVVACCVADATGAWLPVQSPDADGLAKDEWVRVEGQVAIGADGSPVVQASAVTRVEAPSNPYIYP